jgi:hypothetical protein
MKISRWRGEELPSNSFVPISIPKEPNLIEANWVEPCCAKINEKELGALNNKVPRGEISMAKNQTFRAEVNSLGLGSFILLQHPINPVFQIFLGLELVIGREKSPPQRTSRHPSLLSL